MSRKLWEYKKYARIHDPDLWMLKAYAPSWAIGMLFNRHALWVGVHYSNYTKRYCINLLPCLTLYFVRKGGKTP